MENKTGKYFKYAIGEIILVVIGILIALSINNWNENRKAHIADTKFLHNLRQEIELDTFQIDRSLNSYERINMDLKKTLQLLDDQSNLTEEDYKIISSAIKSMDVLTPLNKNTEKNNMKLAEGTLLNINNELNMKYQRYIEKAEEGKVIYNKLGESLQSIVIQIVDPTVDLRLNGNSFKVDFNFDELKNNRLVKNGMVKSIRWRNLYMNSLKKQKGMAVELLKILDKELK